MEYTAKALKQIIREERKRFKDKQDEHTRKQKLAKIEASIKRYEPQLEEIKATLERLYQRRQKLL